MEGVETMTAILPASRTVLAMRLTQIAKVTIGASLSTSPSSSQGRLGLGPVPLAFPAGRSGDSSESDSTASSSLCCARIGMLSEERKISFGVRFFCRMDLGPPLPVSLGVTVPYEPEPAVGETSAELAVLGGDEVSSCSLIVAGTSRGRNADASSSVEYSLSKSWGIAESNRQSMYRYCSINSFVLS